MRTQYRSTRANGLKLRRLVTLSHDNGVLCSARSMVHPSRGGVSRDGWISAEIKRERLALAQLSSAAFFPGCKRHPIMPAAIGADHDVLNLAMDPPSRCFGLQSDVEPGLHSNSTKAVLHVYHTACSETACLMQGDVIADHSN